MPAGRPPTYKTPEEMQIVIEEYFDNDAWFEDGEKREFRPTVSGLAYTLGISTESLRNYELKEEFLATVKAAKQLVEVTLEQRLYGSAVTGLIFNLKNNFGWKDKSEIDQHNTGEAMINALFHIFPFCPFPSRAFLCAPFNE